MTQLSMKYTLPEPILSTQQSLHFQPSQQNYTQLHWDYFKKKNYNSVILWVNPIGQDTAGHREKTVIQARYQESGPNITADFKINEGGQDRWTEKLLISIFCAQAGRPAQQTQLFCLPKSLASSTNFWVLLRTFSESAKAFRYRSWNHRGDRSNQQVKPFPWHCKPLRNALKKRRLGWAPAFSCTAKSFHWLTRNCNSLGWPKEGQKYSGHWMTEFSWRATVRLLLGSSFLQQAALWQLISHSGQDSQGDYLHNSPVLWDLIPSSVTCVLRYRNWFPPPTDT